MDEETIWRFNKIAKGESTSTTLEKIWAVALGAAIALFLIAIFGIPLLIYSVWACAFVGKTLWAWFVVPVFHLPLLTAAQAWGLSSLINMWTSHHHVCKSEDERKPVEKVMEVIVLVARPWLILLFGWICYHYFIPQ